MNKKLAAKIKSLPKKPGAYLFKDKTGRILYIGKAVNLRNRVRSHFNPSSQSKFNPPAPPFAKGGLGGISDIDFIITADEKEALILENELIKKYKPKYNIQWRDDKSYFWVNFTADDWPRVRTTHQPSLRGVTRSGTTKQSRGIAAANNNAPSSRRDVGTPPPLKLRPELSSALGGWGELFQPIGPFTNGTELKQVLRNLRKILPYRTCKNAYDKPCLQWHLGLCPAHDSSCHSRESGNPGFCRSELVSGPGSRVKPGMTKIQYSQSLNTLRQLLRLYANEPIRIEAYDISNIQGSSATGSMIVFKGFKPDKSQYRKFRIKTVRATNDIAMLKEVLHRRLDHTEWPLPDLILIDGGRAQLNSSALEIRNWKLEIPLFALAKRADELYTIYSNRTLHLKSLPIDLCLLFQAIRNEAHRFAISYYRKLHRRKIVTD